MVEHMIAEGYATTVEDYLAAARAVRSQWEADRPGQALSYTELRRRAVGAELRRAAGDPRLPVDDLVEACCAVREHERHAAAEYYLPPGVVETLHAVKKHFGGNVCIGAVTNGGGDPLKMPSLAPFFSFCVSGEDPEVFPHRKPHPGIFRRALHRYRTEHYAPSQEAARDEEEGDGGGPDGGEEDFLWCHVGDCLANDVGASADCGAFSVWCAPDPQAAAASVLLGLAAEQGGGGGEPSPAPSLPGTGPPAAEGGRGPGGRDPRQQPGWSEAAQDELERRSELAHRAQDKISAHIYGIPQLLDVLKRVARPDRHAKLQRRRR
jgi:FMN phosphatase YigB (HAD superfamily)